jgi:hypothetical protein
VRFSAAASLTAGAVRLPSAGPRLFRAWRHDRRYIALSAFPPPFGSPAPEFDPRSAPNSCLFTPSTWYLGAYV